MDVVCGFMVVRLPQANFDAEHRGAFTRVAPAIDDIFYGGFDRMPWFDVDEALYAGTLPSELRVIREGADSADFTGLDLVADVEHARHLLSFANREESNNEIIALFSDLLASIKGTVSIASGELEWLGYDVGPLGHSSLLLEGLFASPELFSEFRTVVNRAGLLLSELDVERYVRRYRVLSERGLAEPIIEDPYRVESVRIARLCRGH